MSADSNHALEPTSSIGQGTTAKTTPSALPNLSGEHVRAALNLDPVMQKMVHDFNNQLTGIICYQELAAEDLAPDHPARACLLEAQRAAIAARAHVNRLLGAAGPLV
jgi:hypothetical protein